MCVNHPSHAMRRVLKAVCCLSGPQLRAGALEGALRDCPPAAAAAKCAAAAEVVAGGDGGPAAGRPLAQLADLAAAGAFHGVPAASRVPAAAGARPEAAQCAVTGCRRDQTDLRQ